MVSPFDPKTVLLAKHAQHVVLIHFPIALFIAGVAFDFLGRWTKRPELADAAYYNFVGAALTIVPVLATGVLAWQLQLEGQRVKGILLMHMAAAGVSSAVIGLVWWLHWRMRGRKNATTGFGLLALELVGVGAVAVTGHLGGFLSGVNGVS
jgi:uncharacterized membrane protein